MSGELHALGQVWLPDERGDFAAQELGLSCSSGGRCACGDFARGYEPSKAFLNSDPSSELSIRALGLLLNKHLCFQVPFEDAPFREALRKVASRHTGGKVVINMELGGGADVASVSNQ